METAFVTEACLLWGGSIILVVYIYIVFFSFVRETRTYVRVPSLCVCIQFKTTPHYYHQEALTHLLHRLCTYVNSAVRWAGCRQFGWCESSFGDSLDVSASSTHRPAVVCSPKRDVSFVVVHIGFGRSFCSLLVAHRRASVSALRSSPLPAPLSLSSVLIFVSLCLLSVSLHVNIPSENVNKFVSFFRSSLPCRAYYNNIGWLSPRLYLSM